MANKTVLKKEKKVKCRWSRYFTSGDARAYLFIHLSKPSNWITEFSELTRKYIFLTTINTAAKSTLVQLCYHLTREFSSTFSRINRQTSIPTETEVLQTCSKAVRPCRWKKIQFKRNQLYSSSSLSMKILRLFWGSWIIVSGPLEILNWRSQILRMSTPEKEPLGCLNLMVLEDV